MGVIYRVVLDIDAGDYDEPQTWDWPRLLDVLPTDVTFVNQSIVDKQYKKRGRPRGGAAELHQLAGTVCVTCSEPFTPEDLVTPVGEHRGSEWTHASHE